MFPKVAIALVLVLGGCACNRATFRLEDMEGRHLETPFDALDYFRFALRTRNWEAAYDALSKETQKLMEEKYLGRLGFENFADRVDLERLEMKAPDDLKSMKLVELIHRAAILNIDVNENYTRAVVFLSYPKLAPEPFVLTNEKTKDGKDRWVVDIGMWLELRNQ